MTQSAMTLPRIGDDDFERDARPLPEEQALLERLRTGDEAAFTSLFERHWDAVCRLLIRLTGDADAAGDLAQEVFVQLYRKPPLNADVPLRAWLFRVALNRGYNALRADRRRRTREETVAGDPAAGGAADGAAGVESLEEIANRAEERDSVRRVLMRLSERQRDCLVLRANGLSYAEIAVAIGVAPGSVGTLLARAERAFKAEYLARRGGL
ncbi:MAG TPA: sigma-70 family RNA polymerase sigma factor [Chloroflexota bacterium]|nr:sigma-70 family RNA polymerase sigma factor [Chloroflexota bacterium]